MEDLGSDSAGSGGGKTALEKKWDEGGVEAAGGSTVEAPAAPPEAKEAPTGISDAVRELSIKFRDAAGSNPLTMVYSAYLLLTSVFRIKTLVSFTSSGAFDSDRLDAIRAAVSDIVKSPEYMSSRPVEDVAYDLMQVFFDIAVMFGCDIRAMATSLMTEVITCPACGGKDRDCKICRGEGIISRY